MIVIEPDCDSDSLDSSTGSGSPAPGVHEDTRTKDRFLCSTRHILSMINKHSSSIAVILLPGVQYYTGQLFDIQTITDHAHSISNGEIIVAWDLAHAVGNVPLDLHRWSVDFAIWCNYKYVNGGPGCIGGLFVHERHTRVDMEKKDEFVERSSARKDDRLAEEDKNEGDWKDEEQNGANGLELRGQSDEEQKKKNNEAERRSYDGLGYRPRLAGWWG